MAAVEPAALQQAALLLHGMPEPARENVLARLETSHVARLRPLLAELIALRIPVGLGRQLQIPACAPIMPALTLQQQVGRLEPTVAAQALRRCAPMTVACVLQAQAWSWQAQVLAAMPPRRRGRVQQCLRGELPALAPALLAALCRRLCMQGDLMTAQAPAKQPPVARGRRWVPWKR